MKYQTTEERSKFIKLMDAKWKQKFNKKKHWISSRDYEINQVIEELGRL